MSNTRHSPLDVRETDYLSVEFGPPEDTDVFQKGTPAPGERNASAPSSHRAGEDPKRMQRQVSTPPTSPLKAPLPLPSRGLMLAISTGLVLALTVGSVLLWALSPSIIHVPKSAPNTTAAPEDATWKGLKVKKGLR